MARRRRVDPVAASGANDDEFLRWRFRRLATIGMASEDGSPGAQLHDRIAKAVVRIRKTRPIADQVAELEAFVGALAGTRLAGADGRLHEVKDMNVTERFTRAEYDQMRADWARTN